MVLQWQTNRKPDKFLALVSLLKHICKVDLLAWANRVDTIMWLPWGMYHPLLSHAFLKIMKHRAEIPFTVGCMYSTVSRGVLKCDNNINLQLGSGEVHKMVVGDKWVSKQRVATGYVLHGQHEVVLRQLGPNSQALSSIQQLYLPRDCTNSSVH